MKILIISHFGGTYNHIASNRINGFLNYFTKLGHETHLVTLDRGEYSDNNNIHYVKNSQKIKKFNLNQNGSSKLIHKIKTLYNLLVGKVLRIEHKSWERDAFSYSLNLNNTKNFDIVISSYGPFSSLEVGSKLKKHNTKIKWVIDLRDDLMTPNDKKRFNKFNLEEIDMIVSVSQPILNDVKFRTKYNKNLLELKNGFDFEVGKPIRRVNPYFKITYSGSFYGDRNPENFFLALKDIKIEYPQVFSMIKVEFIGITKPLTIPVELKSNINIINKRISYVDNVERLRASDCLLLILPETKNKGIYSGKIFDYMGVARPILGLVPDDVAKDLLIQVGSGNVADEKDVNEIKEAILSLFKLWESDIQFKPNMNIINQLHRSYQTEMFSVELNKLLIENK